MKINLLILEQKINIQKRKPEKPVLQKFTVCRQNLYVKCLQCGGVMYQGRASIEYTIGRQFLGTTYRPLFLSIEAN